ncbi:MAG: PASTA domain-containing protein [Acidobacteriota bacterium]
MGVVRIIWTIVRRLSIILILMLAFISSAMMAIYLSRGKEVVVPKMIGKSQSEAQKIASAVGLQIEAIEIFDEKAPANTIVRQEPKAGLMVKQGYKIKIYLSRGEKKSLINKPETGAVVLALTDLTQ